MNDRGAIARPGTAAGSRLRARGASLRQRVAWFLPVALFALMLQILAPVGASLTTAAALADPLHGTEICHSDVGSDAAPGDQGGDHHAGSLDCMLCCLSHAGGALDTPKPVVQFVLVRESIQVVWRGQALDLPRATTSPTAQARAPPTLS